MQLIAPSSIRRPTNDSNRFKTGRKSIENLLKCPRARSVRVKFEIIWIDLILCSVGQFWMVLSQCLVVGLRSGQIYFKTGLPFKTKTNHRERHETQVPWADLGSSSVCGDAVARCAQNRRYNSGRAQAEPSRTKYNPAWSDSEETAKQIRLFVAS